MTYTLTQFENVDKLQLRINGHTQEEMPVNGTPIKEGYTRANGINLKESDTLDLVDSQGVTMYYPAEHNENRYYVAVTQHINSGDQAMCSAIVQSLLNGACYNTMLTKIFQ